MSLSNNHRKIITRLQQKKYRQNRQLFVAEGVKVVNEFLASSFKVFLLFATEDFKTDHPIIKISDDELKKISQLKSPNQVLGVFEMLEEKPITNDGIIVVLDAVNDPGNLGTIIRLCDWFGVKELVCSKDTVDCYNFKVVQASMGSLTRVNVIYTDLENYLKKSNLPIYIADMNGQNIYSSSLPDKAILVMGNEANGVSQKIKELADVTISIPRFGEHQITESLNVATATAILLSEFKRN